MRAHPPVSHSDTYIGVSVGHLSQQTMQVLSMLTIFLLIQLEMNRLDIDLDAHGLQDAPDSKFLGIEIVCHQTFLA